MMSMHSLLSRTIAVDIPDNIRHFDMLEIRRDTTRHVALLYIMVLKKELHEKLLSKSKESYFIEPMAEIVVRGNKIILSKRPNKNNGIAEACDLENYFCNIVRLDSKRSCGIVI
jgi:hypothetical protein